MKKGWTTKRVGEIATIKPPKSEARERVTTDALVSFLPMEDLGIAIKYPEPKQTRKLSDVVGSYTYFAEGDVLLAKITPCFENGKLGIAKGLKNGIGFGSSEFIAIRPDPTVSNEWLFHFLSRDDFRNEGAQRMGGAVGQQRVPKEFVEGYEIPVPPLAEQRRIVGVLDEAFAGLALAQAHAAQNLQNARALFESHLQSVFSHPGNGWVEKALEEVAADDCALSYGIVQPGDDVEGGLPVVRPTDLTSDIITPDGLKRIEPKRAESYQRTTLQGGELLLCVRGSTGVLSKAAPELAGANVTRGIVPIRFNSRLLTADFGFHLLRAEPVQAQIRAKTYGAALMQINIGDLRKISLSFPSVHEQQAAATQLDALSAETQRLARIYEQKLAALAALKKSLLHQAFSGEL